MKELKNKKLILISIGILILIGFSFSLSTFSAGPEGYSSTKLNLLGNFEKENDLYNYDDNINQNIIEMSLNKNTDYIIEFNIFLTNYKNYGSITNFYVYINHEYGNLMRINDLTVNGELVIQQSINNRIYINEGSNNIKIIINSSNLIDCYVNENLLYSTNIPDYQNINNFIISKGNYPIMISDVFLYEKLIIIESMEETIEEPIEKPIENPIEEPIENPIEEPKEDSIEDNSDESQIETTNNLYYYIIIPIIVIGSIFIIKKLK